MITPHVLIAEDEQNARFTLSLILRKAGYSVTAVENGRAALECLHDSLTSGKPIDLLITDLRMSGLTGIELLDAIKSLNISLPVVVITGYGTKEMLHRLSGMGIYSYLEKPFNAFELIRTVNQALALTPQDTADQRV